MEDDPNDSKEGKKVCTVSLVIGAIEYVSFGLSEWPKCWHFHCIFT